MASPASARAWRFWRRSSEEASRALSRSPASTSCTAASTPSPRGCSPRAGASMSASTTSSAEGPCRCRRLLPRPRLRRCLPRGRPLAREARGAATSEWPALARPMLSPRVWAGGWKRWPRKATSRSRMANRCSSACPSASRGWTCWSSDRVCRRRPRLQLLRFPDPAPFLLRGPCRSASGRTSTNRSRTCARSSAAASRRSPRAWPILARSSRTRFGTTCRPKAWNATCSRPCGG
mmetsp:Transcript_20569/g.57378  ORF Transcript_20569/g.57378 Transcript_20569/m.57378 type:complete len:235 (-) Transcript_20569:670-1374(-)